MEGQGPRNRTVGAKVTGVEAEAVRRAAEVRGESVSSFIRQVAVDAAWRVVLNQQEGAR